MPLGFLVRRTGTESRRVNRICLWSDKEGYDETSQPMMLSRSLKDSRVMPITSILQPLYNVGSFPHLESPNSKNLKIPQGPPFYHCS